MVDTQGLHAMNRCWAFGHHTGLLIGLLAVIGCAPSQFTTLTIYESPQSFVRLEVDRDHDRDTGHSHPIDIAPEQMGTLLSGLVFEEPVAKLPFYDDLSQPRRHPAFTASEVTLFAPLLATALKKAGPDELVTFYHSTARSATQRLVTSGGVFVEHDQLHLILANYRSLTQFSADSGVVDTTDDRLTPLRSLAPQRGRLAFDPSHAVQEPDTGLETWFQPKRQEIIIHYKRLQSNRSFPPSTTSDPQP